MSTPPDAAAADAARAARAARRAFVRDHHPDRGGDPAAFVSGLARHRTAPTSTGAGVGPVVVVRRPSWPARLVALAWRQVHPPPPRVR